MIAAALVELVVSGGMGALFECGLGIDCYLPAEITSVDLGIALMAIGVLSLLAAISVGRKPGD